MQFFGNMKMKIKSPYNNRINSVNPLLSFASRLCGALAGIK